MFHVSRRTITLSLLLAGLGSAAVSAPASAAGHHGLLPAVQISSGEPAQPVLLLPAVQSAREAARR